jgi:hypothetical protein
MTLLLALIQPHIIRDQHASVHNLSVVTKTYTNLYRLMVFSFLKIKIGSYHKHYTLIMSFLFLAVLGFELQAS